MASVTLTGSCLCGAVRYTAQGEPLRAYHCHCSRCRKAGGGGHATNMFIKGRLTWDAGESLIKRHRVPEAKRFTNVFCSECGSRVPRISIEPDTVWIPMGSLDVEPPLQPQARIFTASRASWSCGKEPLPEFDEYPD